MHIRMICVCCIEAQEFLEKFEIFSKVSGIARARSSEAQTLMF